MPITSGEFDDRRIDFRIHIMRVLEAAPGDAYHTSELVELVSGLLTLELNAEDFQSALRSLETAGRVEHTVIQGIHYWRWKRMSGTGE